MSDPEKLAGTPSPKPEGWALELRLSHYHDGVRDEEQSIYRGSFTEAEARAAWAQAEQFIHNDAYPRTGAGRGVPDARVPPIRWSACACGAEHDTPTCPFGAVQEARVEPHADRLDRQLIAAFLEEFVIIERAIQEGQPAQNGDIDIDRIEIEIAKLQAAVPAALRAPREPGNEVIEDLEERAAWYRDGCDGLEDLAGYYASGDCARDAARDLGEALSELRVLEKVIAKMRAVLPTSSVVTTDAVVSAIGFLSRPDREQVRERLGIPPSQEFSEGAAADAASRRPRGQEEEKNKDNDVSR